ncbi:MAG: DUF4160 domain-containing protein [Ignavibacteriaceae bacterium]
MPEISNFLGMSIKMVFQDHDPPHVHIYQRNLQLAVVLFDGTVREGYLEKDKLRILKKWLVLHQEELIACWNNAKKKKHPGTIEPWQ